LKPRIRHGRKLLVASLGVAAVSYVACGGSTKTTSGNLMAPEAGDAQIDHPTHFDAVGNLALPDAAPDHPSTVDVVGNLAPPMDAGDAQHDPISVFDVVANLALPPDGGNP
jgi:hypothetical protein